MGRLAALGVQTDPASFRALADTWHSATAMVVHGWQTPMPDGVLDRDLLLLATRELYRRWVDCWLCLEDIDELGPGALQGWFVTVTEEARAAAEEEDPEVAGLALPILERLAQAEGLHAIDQVEVLVALGRVWITTGQADRVRPDLLAWSEEKASGAGVVALVEVLGAWDDGAAPETRCLAAELLRGARDRGWEDWDELGGDELVAEIEALLEG